MLNKMDLGKQVAADQLARLLPQAKFIDAAVIEEKGIKELEDSIVELVYGGQLSQEKSDIITNARHKDLWFGRERIFMMRP